MITIRVRYYAPTNTRGAKLVATDGSKHLRIAYQYENDDLEKLNAAKEFCRIFLKYAPDLNPIPSEFNGDSFYSFKEKPNLQAIDKHIESVLQHELVKPCGTHMFTKGQLIAMLKQAILTLP